MAATLSPAPQINYSCTMQHPPGAAPPAALQTPQPRRGRPALPPPHPSAASPQTPAPRAAAPRPASRDGRGRARQEAQNHSFRGKHLASSMERFFNASPWQLLPPIPHPSLRPTKSSTAYPNHRPLSPLTMVAPSPSPITVPSPHHGRPRRHIGGHHGPPRRPRMEDAVPGGIIGGRRQLLGVDVE